MLDLEREEGPAAEAVDAGARRRRAAGRSAGRRRGTHPPQVLGQGVRVGHRCRALEEGERGRLEEGETGGCCEGGVSLRLTLLLLRRATAGLEIGRGDGP
jgi:hypothetical protein